jgi:hypothetical protein
MLTFLGSLVLLLIIMVLLRLVRGAENGVRNSKISVGNGLLSSVLYSLGAPSRIVVNGQTYSSIDDMPPEVRAQYEHAMGLTLAATERDRVLDFPGRVRALRASASTTARPDPATRLKQLQEMKDSDLITDEEYEAKRAQILEAL